jgi:hypothetical protein
MKFFVWLIGFALVAAGARMMGMRGWSYVISVLVITAVGILMDLKAKE